MISPELVRRYPFFAGLNMEQITTLAKAADELSVEPGHYFFKEGEELSCFYIIYEGQVGIVVNLPSLGKEVAVSTLGPGDMFGWSALVPPYETTAPAKAMTRCRVFCFDCRAIRAGFSQDWQFAYIMMERTAQIIRERLRDLRIESLAYAIA